MRWLRIGALVLAAVGVLVGAGLYWLLAPEAVPEASDYRIDRAALERTARSLPGPLPVRVNHLKVAEATLPRAALFSGFDFSPHRMVHGAYQVVYPDGSYALIDSGFGAKIAEQMAARGEVQYDAEAFAALARALPRARVVVMTHEHLDHIEGLAEVDDLQALSERVFLPVAQYANPQTRALLPAELLDAIEPVAYQGVRAIAPGIAVQPAPGHTPGSQLVFVRLADGRGFLFIGDVAWHMEMIRELAYRPRLVTDYVLGEDRGAVMAQLRTLHEMLDDPEMWVVSSHDADQLARLQQEGEIGRGLEPDGA